MNDYDLWFYSLNFSNKIKSRLIKKFKKPEILWYHVIEKNNTDTENDKIIYKLKHSWNKEKINLLKDVINKEKINVVTINDEKYPKQLKNFEDSPYLLYYKGNIININKNINVGIVGSRKCTEYGLNVTKIISKQLSKANINIISGMALGIDSCAQKTSIENKKYTCAILGSGVDVIYPRQNKKLYNDLVNKGCVISEFLPGTKPYSYNFPIRNRIISGISDIIVVVEANEKSGSLITARIAAEQGKDVVAVPGSVFSRQSKGTNKLIDDGAYPFIDMNSIGNLLGIKFVKENTKEDDCMSKSEKQIYKLLKDKPIHIDDIMKKTKVDIKQIYEVLFEMQIKKEIMCLAGNYYVRINNKF